MAKAGAKNGEADEQYAEQLDDDESRYGSAYGTVETTAKGMSVDDLVDRLD